MPTPHDVHSVAPAVSEYLPAVQLAQLADPVTEDSPAEQSSQDVRSPVETLPAAQSAHEAEPSESENVPASHDVHGVLASESRSALPTAQSVHAVAPTAEYVPPVHSAQEPMERAVFFSWWGYAWQSKNSK